MDFTRRLRPKGVPFSQRQRRINIGDLEFIINGDFQCLVFFFINQMSMNAVKAATPVTSVLHASTQMVHLPVRARTDTLEMGAFARV